MALDTCPECAISLKDMSAEELQAHRDHHWEGQIPFPQQNKAAVERASAMDAEIDVRRNAERTAGAARRPGWSN